MTRQVTAIAAANIALIKYWGALDLSAAIPANPSISMTLRECVSRCTCSPSESVGTDEIWFRGSSGVLQPAPESFAGRVRAHLDALRDRLDHRGFFRILTENTFPAGAGMASSASGFCALATAVSASIGELPTPEELSIRARLSGSGSATRSAMGGYVIWPGNTEEPEGPARQLFAEDHWDLRDVVAIVQSEEKKVSSLEGHRRAPSSPYFEGRLQTIPERLDRVRTALADRNWPLLADVLEEEAIDLHLIAMSSKPAVFYWSPATLRVLEAVRQMRADGFQAASTMDAGANVHVLCTPTSEHEVAARLRRLEGVERVICDRVGPGPRLSQEKVS